MFNAVRLARRGLRSGPKSGFGAFQYGMMGVGLTGVGGLAYSIKHALSPTTDNHLSRAAVWPEYVRERLRGTFGYCLGGIGVTTAGAMATLRSQTLMRMVGSNTMFSFIGCIALMMASGYACQAIPFNGSVFGGKALAYYAHMGIVGAVIAPIAAAGGPVCIRAAALTAAVMSGLCLTAMVSPNDAYLNTYGPVNAGCAALLGACLVSFIAPIQFQAGLSSLIIFGGLALFSVKGFTDIQKTVTFASQPGEFDPINHSVHITMDAINIFIRLVMIMSMGKKK